LDKERNHGQLADSGCVGQGSLSDPAKTLAGNRIIRLGENTLIGLREQKKSVVDEIVTPIPVQLHPIAPAEKLP